MYNRLMDRLIERELNDSLEAFSECTGVPVTCFSADGRILHEYNADKKYCQFFPIYRRPGKCRDALLFSSQLSFELGEPYIYGCPAGLFHIAVPIIEHGTYKGSAVAGPIIINEMDPTTLETALQLDPAALSRLTEVAEFLSGMPKRTPNWVHKLSILMYSAVIQGTGNWEDYEQKYQEKQRSQLYGASQILMLGRSASGAVSDEIYKTRIQERITKWHQNVYDRVSAHDPEGALAVTSDYFSDFDSRSAKNEESFQQLKSQVFDLFLDLTHKAADQGFPLRQILEGNFLARSRFAEITDRSALGNWTGSMIRFFSGKVFETSVLSDILRKILNYIEAHYAEKLTLDEVAERNFISGSYLSKLFRRELNTTFSAYLNKTRIDHSILLMNDTEYSLSEIAEMCGFEEQGYYSRVFRKRIGTTPRQYRKQILNKKLTEDSSLFD